MDSCFFSGTGNCEVLRYINLALSTKHYELQFSYLKDITLN